MIILKFLALLLCLFPVARLVWDKPDLSFWIFLNMYFNPGGLITKYFDLSVLGRLDISDIIMVGIVICFYKIKSKNPKMKISKVFKQYLKYLLIYIIYYYVVYGFISPYLHNDLNYPLFLLKSRHMLYGIILLFATYYFASRNLKYFYTVTLAIGSIILVMYFITLVTGLDLISYTQSERYRGSGMMRIGISSYGLTVYLLPLAIVTFLAGKRRVSIKYKKLLYTSGILMALTMLFTLTRRHILDITGLILLGIILSSYLFKTMKIKAVLKFILPLFLLVVITSLVLPQYVGYIIKISEDTFSLVFTGEDTRGEGNYRVSGTGDLLLVKNSIANNILIGNGYTYLYWGDNGMATSPRGYSYAQMADAALEVPIYYTLFGFGIIGTLIIVLLYSRILKIFLSLLRKLKVNYHQHRKDSYFIVITLFVLLYFAKLFTIDLYNFGSVFHKGFSSNSIILGITFALNQQFKNEKKLSRRQDNG